MFLTETPIMATLNKQAIQEYLIKTLWNLEKLRINAFVKKEKIKYKMLESEKDALEILRDNIERGMFDE